MIIKTCPACGKIMRYGSARCADCTAKLLERKKKRKTNYDARRTPEEVKFRNSKEWRMKRPQILMRDGYLCQECKRHGKITIATEVHHVEPLWKRWDLRLADNNLESECHRCHVLIEPPREVSPGVG